MSQLIATQEIWSGVLKNSGGPYYTSSDFNDMLSRGSTLVVQLIVESTDSPGAGSFDVTATYYRSNDGKVWDKDVNFAPKVVVAGTPTFPLTVFGSSDGLPMRILGSKGRFLLENGGIDNAVVRLIASVRG